VHRSDTAALVKWLANGQVVNRLKGKQRRQRPIVMICPSAAGSSQLVVTYALSIEIQDCVCPIILYRTPWSWTDVSQSVLSAASSGHSFAESCDRHVSRAEALRKIWHADRNRSVILCFTTPPVRCHYSATDNSVQWVSWADLGISPVVSLRLVLPGAATEGVISVSWVHPLRVSPFTFFTCPTSFVHYSL